MKTTLFLTIAIIAQTIFSQNRITNGNFEDGKNNWGGYNNQVLFDDIANSNVGNVNTGDGSLFQVFTMTPGTTYNVAFDYRWVSGTGNYNMTVTVKIGETDATNLTTFVLNTTPDVWHTANISFTAPQGISQARIIFYKGANNRPLRMDNVTVIDENYHPTFVDPTSPTNAQPNGVPGNWVLDFSDEFNGADLNLTKWYKSVSNSPRAPRENLGVTDWRWIADNAFLNNSGQLVLRATKINNTTNIALPRLATGMYIVQLQNENGRINKKIILE